MGKRKKELPHPILDSRIADGTIFSISNGEYIGQASDGVFVQMGYVGDEERLEKYLTANPTPDMW